jgi:hypothetical protein
LPPSSQENSATRRKYPVNNGQVQSEITGDLTAVMKSNNSEKMWKTISIVLGLIITGGTILSVIGKAFYVTRTEYTERVLQESVKEDRLANSLDTLRVSISNLDAVLKQDIESINNIKLEMAKRR